MKVSVVVCTRDRLEYLEKCVHSLLNQSCKPKELIIIDDASKDEIDILKMLENVSSSLNKSKYKEYVDVILLRNKKRQGVVKSRNLGIIASSGEVVAFLDDDSYANKDWIKNLAKNYDKSVAGVGGPVVEKSRSDGAKVMKRLSYITHHGDIRHHYRIRDMAACKKLPKQHVKFLMGGNMSFRKDVILKAGSGDASFKGNYYREETDLCIRISKFGKLVFEPAAVTFHNTANKGGTRDIYTMGSFLYWYFRNTTLFFLRNFDFSVAKIFRHARHYIRTIKSGKTLTNRAYLKRESEIKSILSIYNGLISGLINGFVRKRNVGDYRKPKYVIALRVRFLEKGFSVLRHEGLPKSLETSVRIYS